MHPDPCGHWRVFISKRRNVKHTHPLHQPRWRQNTFFFFFSPSPKMWIGHWMEQIICVEWWSWLAYWLCAPTHAIPCSSPSAHQGNMAWWPSKGSIVWAFYLMLLTWTTASNWLGLKMFSNWLIHHQIRKERRSILFLLFQFCHI